MREYMSAEELAEYLGITMETVKAFFPPPPSFKLGEFLKYKRSEVDRWVDEINNEQTEQNIIKAETLKKQSQEKMRDKNYEEAKKMICDSIFLYAKDPDSHFIYGYILARQEKWPEAEFELRKGLKMNPKADWRDEAKYQITMCQKAQGTFFAEEH